VLLCTGEFRALATHQSVAAGAPGYVPGPPLTGQTLLVADFKGIAEPLKLPPGRYDRGAERESANKVALLPTGTVSATSVRPTSRIGL
jgi:hypothetical protein